VYAQQDSDVEETGLPGDNFSLEGALELFKKSSSPEEYEKLLNTQDNHVNNLDLNEDGDIDYIQVINVQEKDAHVFILRVPVSEKENQDIATIHLEKTGKDEANVQIVGDEEIFGEELILEPSDEESASTEMKKGPYTPVLEDDIIVVNVWAWPCVRFVYAPGYRPWVSPWRWRYYPTWWKPWRPFGWNVWRPYRVHYHRPTIRVVPTHRLTRAHGIYKPVRVSSTTVKTRYAGAHANYKVTRSKTKVTGPRGNSVTKKTTTVKGPKGNTKVKKTTVKKSRK
jgi:hypothetical protein